MLTSNSNLHLLLTVLTIKTVIHGQTVSDIILLYCHLCMFLRHLLVVFVHFIIASFLSCCILL